MAGLDKIISQIKEESQKAAERTRAEARSKADEILAQARADAERECVDIERRSKQAVANILERGRTAAELKKRGAVLAEKQRLIGATIGMAKAELKGLETGAYFDMILKLATVPLTLSLTQHMRYCRIKCRRFCFHERREELIKWQTNSMFMQ